MFEVTGTLTTWVVDVVVAGLIGSGFGFFEIKTGFASTFGFTTGRISFNGVFFCAFFANCACVVVGVFGSILMCCSTLTGSRFISFSSFFKLPFTKSLTIFGSTRSTRD